MLNETDPAEHDLAKPRKCPTVLFGLYIRDLIIRSTVYIMVERQRLDHWVLYIITLAYI